MIQRLTPTQIIVLGFAAVILLGTFLLLLPFATPPDRPISVLDALFTATSAVCVTGLIVKDTPLDFTGFGHGVILVLMQVGGLGYMTTVSVLALLVGRRLGLREELTLKTELNLFAAEDLRRYVRGAILLTLLAEGIAAALLTLRFQAELGLARGGFTALFLAVSAFNQGGFSLFSDSLASHVHDPFVNLAVLPLMALGAVGFIVIHDVVQRLRGRHNHLSLHTKLALTVAGCMLATGILGLLILESGNPRTLGGLPWGERLLAALFQSLTATSTGLSTVEVSRMGEASQFLLVVLMFLGASPGGPGGGIRTTTLGTMVAALWAGIRRNPDVTAFRRRIPPQTVQKAFLLLLSACGAVVLVTLLLTAIEGQPLLPTLFEAVSALGTVGLSLGDGGNLSLSARFSDAGKFIVVVAMYLGRIGPLLFGLALLRMPHTPRVRLPEGWVMIG